MTFEDFCRARVPGAQRFWESRVELDLVAPDPQDASRLLVAEIKRRRMTAAERRSSLAKLQKKRSRCSLRARQSRVWFEVFDARILELQSYVRNGRRPGNHCEALARTTAFHSSYISAQGQLPGRSLAAGIDRARRHPGPRAVRAAPEGADPARGHPRRNALRIETGKHTATVPTSTASTGRAAAR